MAQHSFKIRNSANLEEQSSTPLLPENGDYYYDSSTGFRFRQQGQWRGLGANLEAQSFTMNNNQASPANISDFVVDESVARAYMVECYISRYRDDNSELVEQRSFKLLYRASTATWELGGITHIGDDSGVTLSITAAGQMQYTTTNMAGVIVDELIRWVIIPL